MLLSLVTLAIAVPVGYFRGGRLGRMGDVHVRALWALAVALAAQIGLSAVPPDAPGTTVRGLLAGSLAAVLVFVWANRRLPGMWLVLAGFALNAAVILPNGAMPVAPEAIEFLGGDASIGQGKHRLLTEGDVLWWLGDVIPVPALRIIVSPGDVLLAVGVALFVNRAMQGPRGRHAAPYGTTAGEAREGEGPTVRSA